MAEDKTILIVDVSAETEVIRELTADELAEIESSKLEIETIQAQAQAKVEARTSALAKLAALGLTEEEIAAL